MRSFSSLSAVLLALTLSRVTFGAAVLERQLSRRSTSILSDYPGQGPLPSSDEIARRNATDGSYLPLQNIQGDIFVGMKKPSEIFYFFRINSPVAFKATLKTRVLPLVTSAAVLISPAANQPLAFLNIAFSAHGLTTLGITDNLGDANFATGQWQDAESLNDNLADWEEPFKSGNIHGVFLIGSDDATKCNNLLNQVKASFGISISEVTRLDGGVRPAPYAGHEHFGYRDGISQPAINGFTTKKLPGQQVVSSGAILTRRSGDASADQRPVWALDGSFLAFRKLEQLVPEFNKYLQDNAVQNAARTLTTSQGAALLGARMFGRWSSGAPIDLAPTADDPDLGADPQRNNNFDYSKPSGTQTSSNDQSRCPFSAHIRKTRPRSDQPNADAVKAGIRASIPYGPEVTAAENQSNTTSQERGLAFVMYQSNLSNGFRFHQINWSNNAAFPRGKNVSTPGIDPIIGQVASGATRSVGGLDPNDASRYMSLPKFIKAKGGEYFFVPSIPALKDKIAA